MAKIYKLVPLLEENEASLTWALQSEVTDGEANEFVDQQCDEDATLSVVETADASWSVLYDTDNKCEVYAIKWDLVGIGTRSKST